jgi:anti-anti-sigma factor
MSEPGRRWRPSDHRSTPRGVLLGNLLPEPAADDVRRDGLSVAVQVTADEVLIAPSGDIAPDTVDDLAPLGEWLAEHRLRRRIILDLRDVSFLGACGINLIARLRLRAGRSVEQFVIRSPSRTSHQLLEIAGLDDVVETEPAPSSTGTPGVHSNREGPRPAPNHHQPTNDTDGEAAWDAVIALVDATSPGTHHISLTLNECGMLRTAAANGDLAEELDDLQYLGAQGPCVAAATTGVPAHVPDTTRADQWPGFVANAHRLGVGSMLSMPLLGGSLHTGALNLYSTATHEYGHDQQRAAVLVARHTALLLRRGVIATRTSNGDRASSSDATASPGLDDAVQRARAVAVAQGILMARDGLSRDAAMRLMRRLARDSGQPLGELAERLIASTEEPGDA